MLFNGLMRWRSRRSSVRRETRSSGGIEQLVNRGYFQIGKEASPVDSTYLVVGVARSGTSMIAGTLYHLGLFMGEGCENLPAFEDPALRELLLKGDWQSAERLIARYNETHPTWGTKLPALLYHLNMAHSVFRNPRYIVIYRDIFSIANRNRISMKADLLGDMKRSLHEYQIINDFLEVNNPTALLVSQCSALHEKHGLLEALMSFCGLTPNEEQIAAALDFIQQAPATYLQLSRITRSEGRITYRDDSCVSGWARYLNSDKVPTVVLFVDGRVVASMAADLPCDAPRSAGRFTRTNYGFKFQLGDGARLLNKRIAVRVDDDINYLPFEEECG